LDPLVWLHGIDENHVGEVAELLAYFRALQRQFDLPVLLVHHKRKSAAGGSPRPRPARLERHPCLRRLEPVSAAKSRTPGALEPARRSAGTAAGVSGTGDNNTRTMHLEVVNESQGGSTKQVVESRQRSLEDRVLELLGQARP
jgi:hypothetical protein